MICWTQTAVTAFSTVLEFKRDRFVAGDLRVCCSLENQLLPFLAKLTELRAMLTVSEFANLV